MKRLILVAATTFAIVGLFWFPGVPMPVAHATQKKKDQGEVIGAVWQYEVRERAKKDSEVIEKGRFRATHDGRLYGVAGKQIGTYAYGNKAHDKVTLKITQGKLKGIIELIQKGNKPPTYQGTWKMDSGGTAHMDMIMARD